VTVLSQQQFVQRVLTAEAGDDIPITAWFASLCSNDAVTHLYLVEYSVNGGADVSDFIAAAGQITPNLALVHAQYATKATGGQQRRGLTLSNSLADVTMGYLQSYLALQYAGGAATEQPTVAVLLERARVVNLGDGTAVWLCVLSVSTNLLSVPG
jgi:hypothetical protein